MPAWRRQRSVFSCLCGCLEQHWWWAGHHGPVEPFIVSRTAASFPALMLLIQRFTPGCWSLSLPPGFWNICRAHIILLGVSSKKGYLLSLFLNVFSLHGVNSLFTDSNSCFEASPVCFSASFLFVWDFFF